MGSSVSGRQVLAWRMKRQLLAPVGTVSTAEVVRQLCGVQAQVASSAELAVRIRQQSSRAGDVGRALASGRLIKTWAMRGTLHLLTPEDGAAFLALIAAGRSWHRPSWQRYFGVTPGLVEQLRERTREALAGAPLTREELIQAVTARPGLAKLAESLRSGWGTLLKPIAWQGDLCFGPSRGSNVTFTLPSVVSSRWKGLPEPDAAAPLAIAAYLQTYGPSTAERFAGWLAGGWFGRRQLRTWLAELGDRLAEVEVEGEVRYIMVDDLDDLLATRPAQELRLLPGFDQYVLGPGTDDTHVVPPARRREVSRQSGWIAPVVINGGVVSGTWKLDDDTIRLTWFGEAGRLPRTALTAETERLALIVGRDLKCEISVA